MIKPNVMCGHLTWGMRVRSAVNKGVILLLIVSSLTAVAQSKSDEENARKCLGDYMSGDGARVEKAFHPSATMKYIDVKTGEFKDVPIADYISRVKAAPAPQDRKISITYLNIEGTAAQAQIKIETDKAVLNDYMNLLKVDGEWKIVSKIFSRKDK